MDRRETRGSNSQSFFKC